MSDAEAALDTQLERLSSAARALSRTKDMTPTKMPMWAAVWVDRTYGAGDVDEEELPTLMWSNSVRRSVGAHLSSQQPVQQILAHGSGKPAPDQSLMHQEETVVDD